MSLGLRGMRTAVRRSGLFCVTAAARNVRRGASSFRDVYSKTVLGVVSDVRGHPLEGTVVRDSQGNTARDLRSFVPRSPTQQQQSSGHILVDVGLKFPISINCSRARLGRDREDIAVGDRVVVKLQTPEITEHLMGNPKHTTIHLGKGEFERIVVGSILEGDEDTEEEGDRQQPQDPLSRLFKDDAEGKQSASPEALAGFGDTLGNSAQEQQKQRQPRQQQGADTTAATPPPSSASSQ